MKAKLLFKTKNYFSVSSRSKRRSTFLFLGTFLLLFTFSCNPYLTEEEFKREVSVKIDGKEFESSLGNLSFYKIYDKDGNFIPAIDIRAGVVGLSVSANDVESNNKVRVKESFTFPDCTATLGDIYWADTPFPKYEGKTTVMYEAVDGSFWIKKHSKKTYEGGFSFVLKAVDEIDSSRYDVEGSFLLSTEDYFTISSHPKQ